LREGKGKAGVVAMAMTFVTGRKEYGQNYGQGKLIEGHISRAVIIGK
jgi:hypothetical protein